MLLDLVKGNRSYRGYDESRYITTEELTSLVELARLTPSSVNAQPLKYYLVNEKDEVAVVQKMTKWAKALPQLELPHAGECPTAFIVICQDLTLGESLARYQKDIGIVAQTMLLGAVEMGLGGCMIGNFSASEVSETLNLAENIAPVLIVAIGKPQEDIVLVEIAEGESHKYYRDGEDVHYVPKRKLEDIIIKK
ncbi:MAG: nitroreductase family protein [Bacillota bacterium]